MLFYCRFAFAVYASAQEAEAAITALKAAGPIVFAGKTVRVQQFKSGTYKVFYQQFCKDKIIIVLEQ